MTLIPIWILLMGVVVLAIAVFALIRYPSARVPVIVAAVLVLAGILILPISDGIESGGIEVASGPRGSAHTLASSGTREVRAPSVSEPPAGTAPALPEDGSGFGVPERVRDDFGWWRRESGARAYRPAESGTSAPEWVGDAAGSRIAEATAGGMRFRYWEPGEGGLAAYSESEPDAGAARRAAVASLRDKLALLALMGARQRDERIDVDAYFPLAQATVERDLRPTYVYAEHARAPYGDLFRAAAVLDAVPEPAALARPLLAAINQGWLERQQQYRWTIVLVIGGCAAALALLVLYSLANARTKGYFAWPLRLAGFGALAAVVFVVYLLRQKLAGG